MALDALDSAQKVPNQRVALHDLLLQFFDQHRLGATLRMAAVFRVRRVRDDECRNQSDRADAEAANQKARSRAQRISA
jgi:hypothetical protein